MITVKLKHENDYDEWSTHARSLFACGVKPEAAVWQSPSQEQDLFGQPGLDATIAESSQRRASVPKAFPGLARRAICHNDPERFAKLYRILWRLQCDKTLLRQSADTDIVWLTSRIKAISRDRHKMHAFVRFKKTGDRTLASGELREQFIAWFEPEHYIIELATPFFVKRFANMDWAILTPHASAFWNGSKLLIGSGAAKSDINVSDNCESLWKTYFASTFNPARLKVNAMMSEMPKKYWHNLPEAELIPDMIAKASGRMHYMRSEAVTEPNPLAKKLRQQG